MLVSLIETLYLFFLLFFNAVKLQMYFDMCVLIVTGLGLRKINKLMLVQSASAVPSGCTPYTCNIIWVIISA